MGEGDTKGSEKLKNAGSSANNATGDGTFINLRKKERDKVQQAPTPSSRPSSAN